jgi:hypothetical protein
MPNEPAGAKPTSETPKPAEGVTTPETPKPAATPETKPAATETPAATPAADTKTGEQPKPEGEKPVDAPKPPEHYELKLPEGGSTFVDDADLRDIEALAKKEGWSQEDAQAYLEERVGLASATSAKFLSETKAHPEIGGENLVAAQQRATAVMDFLVPANTPEGEALRRGLVKTGGENWMPLILLLSRAGKAMAEDVPAFGAGTAKTQKTAEEVLYGGSKK